MPKIQDLDKSLFGGYFSSLDLENGFFQVPLREDDRDKTAFLDANSRLMRFTRMSQGFKNISTWNVYNYRRVDMK